MKTAALICALLCVGTLSAYYDGPTPPATPAPPGYVWAWYEPIKGYAFVPVSLAPQTIPQAPSVPSCPDGRCPLPRRR